MNYKKLVNFFFEIETLKSIKRSGTTIARIPNPDSIAEHVAIASQMAFILAKLEGANAEKCACIMLFHDNTEVRIGDINKIQARYINHKECEQAAHLDQMESLPKGEIQKSIQEYFLEYEEQKTQESRICKDADLLELAFQSKIFLEQGFHAKQNWLDNIQASLKTESAQKLFQELIDTRSDAWWDGLKKV